MAVVVGFHCDIISCELARRGVLSGATKASGSGGVAVGVGVTRLVWTWSLIEGSFSGVLIAVGYGGGLLFDD